MPFFRRLLTQHEELLHGIYQHPFNENLARGTLPTEVFHHYLREDGRYLSAYARALEHIQVKLSNAKREEDAIFIGSQMIATVQLEKALNKKQYFVPPSQFSSAHVFYQPAQVNNPEIPAISEYSAHLLRTCEHGSIAEAFACIMPCFWIYYELGKRMQPDIPHHPFKHWIATYSDPEYAKATQKLAELFNHELWQMQANQALCDKVEFAFEKSLACEMDFIEQLMSHESSLQKSYCPEM